MTTSFNVLKRCQPIHQNYLLEASAGTGKTFSIENIVARLLIDPLKPCALENILIVTFTKASTSDLKKRIRQNLSSTLRMLECGEVEAMPDYLAAVFESGAENCRYAKQKLEQSLASFEQAPIFTIHGFCHRMLKEYLFEADVGASMGESEEAVSPSLIYRLIKDFFRIKLSEDLITSGQLKCLLTHKKSQEKLEKALFKLVSGGINIAPVETLQELHGQFCASMRALKQHYTHSDQLIDDFLKLAPFYKNTCDKQKKPKEANINQVKKFYKLLEQEQWSLSDFDESIRNGLYLAEVICPENRVKTSKPLPLDQLHSPEFFDQLNALIVPLLKKSTNPDLILATLAYHCRGLIKTYLEQNEIFGFDDLLSGMYKAVQNDQLTAQIRSRFKTAIIDEFQDTDPVQWEIFQKIFLPENQEECRIYLVGDPKQSIYGFRQADIYTYLAAGQALGPDSKASLETNYRSTAPLIDALNALFAHSTAPNLMALPKLGKALAFQPVQSGSSLTPCNLDDGRGALHLFIYEDLETKPQKISAIEENYFIPFIGKELQHLQAGGINLSECAILVSDHIQAAAMSNCLKSLGLPFVGQHTPNLSKSLAFAAMKELMQAILTPQRQSAIKTALGGPILAWSHSQILKLDDPLQLEAVIDLGLRLRKIWFLEGFSPFFQAFLNSSWLHSTHTVAENLLLRDGGLELYHGLQQIAEMLIESEARQKLSPHKLKQKLAEIEKMESEGDQAVKLRHNPEKEGVRILTIHTSKGLEFEYVFALGVITRSPEPQHLIPLINQGPLPELTLVEDVNDQRYIRHTLEADAEKIRRLYVAFTRAKQRLYAPVLFSQKKCELGTASPMELYLALMGQPEIPFENIYERIACLDCQKSIAFLSDLAKKYAITLSTPADFNAASSLSKPPETVELKAPPEPNVSGELSFMHSFTKLSSAAKALCPPKINLPDLSPPQDFENSLKSSHTLPAGASTGTLLHTLLELIPFGMAAHGRQSRELLNFVGKFTKHTPFEAWQAVIADILFDALTARLTAEQQSFSLQEVREELCYREHEFMYKALPTLHPELTASPGYLKGVIDLLFFHAGKYYILDWKSNWLGPDAQFYEQSQMQSAMAQHDYFLQAAIYKEALCRYLKLTDGRPFDEIFGGIFYLFLRGLSQEPSSFNQGIYFLPARPQAPNIFCLEGTHAP